MESPDVDRAAGQEFLGDRLRRGPLRRRVEWIQEAALALGNAHRRGAAHGELCGERVLVDEAGAVQVTGLGAADLAPAPPTHRAPERLRGESATPATDVWGLGVFLYQALTDALPFEGGDPEAVRAQVLGGRPEPPTQVNPLAPRELEAICVRALARRPGARYPDGSTLAADLGRWLEGQTPRLGRRWGLRVGVALALVFALLSYLVTRGS